MMGVGVNGQDGQVGEWDLACARWDREEIGDTVFTTSSVEAEHEIVKRNLLPDR